MYNMTIRKAQIEDVSAIYQLILELAAFEKGLHEVTMTAAQLAKDFDLKLYDCFVAEIDKTIVGISLYYFRYSTWKGKRLYLEDIIVTESYKKQGIGKKLLDISIEEAKKTDCSGMMWQVLNWNTSAIDFYKKYPVKLDDEWINVSLNFDNNKLTIN